ncbi:MAG TPA: hypothetical protein VLB82_03545 [Thermodesulfobacteriota bacterium]|nr:hypothetical protein [Thermodesulfobacteriota bacterium]
MSKKLYKIKYYINVDVLAEEIVSANDIDIKNLKLNNNEFPSKNAKWIIYDTMKVNRKIIEDYDEITNNSNKERTSNK